MKEKIFSILKTKIASLGFNEDELKGIAEIISSKLGEDKQDATDEEISTLIDADMPYLKLGQKRADRVAMGKAQERGKEAERQRPNKAEETIEEKAKEEAPAWAKEMLGKFETRIAQLEAEKVTATRMERLNAILKDSGTYGTRKLNDYRRMQFATDEDFDTFLEETKTDLASYTKEMSERGLNISPLQGGGNGIPPTQTATDAEADAIADIF